MGEQKQDKQIRKMEKEQRLLSKLIGAKGSYTQRIQKGGWV
jgi:hypothetical protein